MAAKSRFGNEIFFTTSTASEGDFDMPSFATMQKERNAEQRLRALELAIPILRECKRDAKPEEVITLSRKILRFLQRG